MKFALAFCFTGLLISFSFAGAADSDGRSFIDTVPKVAAISSRDAGGRAQRFTDPRNREFAVKYDAQQRVQSVEATLKPHISDLVSIGYAPDGKLLGVRFRTGYTLFFDDQPSGVQVVRDSSGGALRRTGAAVAPVDGAPAEQSAKLAAAITKLEALMIALGQPTR